MFLAVVFLVLAVYAILLCSKGKETVDTEEKEASASSQSAPVRPEAATTMASSKSNKGGLERASTLDAQRDTSKETLAQKKTERELATARKLSSRNTTEEAKKASERKEGKVEASPEKKNSKEEAKGKGSKVKTKKDTKQQKSTERKTVETKETMDSPPPSHAKGSFKSKRENSNEWWSKKSVKEEAPAETQLPSTQTED